MSNKLYALNESQRQMIATGLVLVGDYLKGCAPINQHTNITVHLVKTVELMDLLKEYARACVETADIGVEFRALVRSKRHG